MHFPSEIILSQMALSEAGLWPAVVNDGEQVILAVKLSTDALKWIHRGVPVNMLIGHVKMENAVIRILALEVFDIQTAPQHPNLPQVQSWEIEGLDVLLGENKFTIHFHNEQFRVSTLDATGSLPRKSVQEYLEKRKLLQFHTNPVVTGLFLKARTAFEQAVANEQLRQYPNVELFRFPIVITNTNWNSVSVLDAGEFNPDDANEGQSHEALLLHVLKPNFDGEVLHSPKIKDGEGTRELYDVLAISKDAFVFEAKAFSVFDKFLDQTAERKAANVMKHFEKALSQLQGAMKRLEIGAEIVSNGSSSNRIVSNQFRALHGIVLVSNTNFTLPWLEIGKKLADAQKQQFYFHFISLSEIQRMIAFAKGSSKKLNLMFLRRAEIIASSKNAHLQTDFIP